MRIWARSGAHGLMNDARIMSARVECLLLGVVLALFVGLSVVGITWGLPSRSIDKYLFGDDEPWSGEKIYRLAGAGEKFSPTRGADVDADPLDKSGGEPILLTGTDEDEASLRTVHSSPPRSMSPRKRGAGVQRCHWASGLLGSRFRGNDESKCAESAGDLARRPPTFLPSRRDHRSPYPQASG